MITKTETRHDRRKISIDKKRTLKDVLNNKRKYR